METYILLENVRLYAYHGVGEQERIVGNHYLINLKIKINVMDAVRSDSLEDTISYADVFEMVKKEMAIPSKLLEHVAGRIISALRKTYPAIENIELKLSKNNPPMGADMDYASVLIID
ncbi:dihydroneopterin aldolase [Dysgonomonas capnocytophagoides]|uniref:7,8-dihydroneopterin aldolase n=1 Tax=Dysgonomonas capnocytophagoides TaxID=45254 RepID=A0A4Y8KXB3_9BACT|nr:dihydroneopterin aldolase [Dysgonomonas capnocytophagoides]TFD94271.1 dihydroneopterin aldolase [Dysgonomonas capnocytophagoides]BES63273.1 dihydroneopterin aldolase [Dysgonomonas capnocytophagoides]